MDLAPDNGKTDFIFGTILLYDSLFHIVTILVTKLSPVQLQATGEGNIAPAKRGKRAQFLLIKASKKIEPKSNKPVFF